MSEYVDLAAGKSTTRVQLVFNGETKIFDVTGCDYVIGVTGEGDLIARFGSENRILKPL